MRLIALLLAAVVALAGDPAHVDVFVFDAATGLPVGGAEIRAGGAVALSDEAGFARLEVAVGDVAVAVGGFDVGSLRAVAGRVSEVLVTLEPGVGARATGIEAPPEAPEAGEAAAVGPPGAVRGVVRSAEDGSPLRGARIYARGLDVAADADEQGRFHFEAPPGRWDLSAVRVGFSTGALAVVVEPGGAADVVFDLLPAAARMDDFVVRAPRIQGGASSLLLERKESATVSDVLGAEQMAASGDSDAAGALKRVPGLTLVGGRYVYVRGLGERYSATLLNGASLPSPEPERRVVPLDLFPTAVLESVVIQKTFSPDMPAEFGGGVIRLRTRAVADEPVAKISLKTGFTTGSTFQQGLQAEGGPTDALGIDGGFRALPESVRAASDDESLEEGDRFTDRGYSPEELEAFGEAMPNRWNTTRGVVLPDFGADATVGHGLQQEGRKIGFLLGLGYGSSHALDDYDRSYYLLGAEGALERSHVYHFEAGQDATRLGGILAVGFSPHATQEFRVTTLLARKTDNEVRTYAGANRDVGADIRVTRLRFVERMLLTQQIAGSHTIPPLGGLTVDWRYTWSVATRGEPDRREYRYDNEPGTDVWLLSDRPEGNQRFFSNLDDRGHDVGLDVALPFEQWGGLEARVAVGGGYFDKRRAVDTRRFKFMHKGASAGDPAILSGAPESVFTPGNIGPDGFQFEEVTRQTDNYSAGQTIGSLYGLIDLPLTAWLRVMGGARLEHSVQDVSTFELFNPDNAPVQARLDTVDVLPALTVTAELRPGMLVRAGYGLTVSRPDFRELSPATFNDVTGGRQTFGNPELERARIHNVDLRWEWYPSPQESLSVGGFYKHFERPIEQIVVVSAQHSVTWDNAEAADNVGFELDGRKDFGFLHPHLADLYLAGNVAIVWSQVRLGDNAGIQSSDQRALQGQSPVVLNVSVGYDNPINGTRLALLYNVFGRRIGEVGALGAPDNYEEPVHQLDFVASQRLPAGFSLGLKIQNLLDAEAVFTQGEQEVERSRRGVSFGLTLSWDIAALAKQQAARRVDAAP